MSDKPSSTSTTVATSLKGPAPQKGSASLKGPRSLKSYGPGASPIEALPPRFSRYLSIPQRVAFVWCVVSLFLFIFVAQGHPPIDDSPSSTSQSGEVSSGESPSSVANSTLSSISVRVGSPFDIDLSLADSGGVITSGPLAGARLTQVDGVSAKVESAAGSPLAFLKVEETEDGRRIELLDPNSNLAYRVKGDEDGLKLLNAKGDLTAKIKFKEEKFNIYGSDGNRRYYGKEKRGSILVRDDRGGDITTISSNSSLTLKEASVLCLPVEAQYRALLFWGFRQGHLVR